MYLRLCRKVTASYMDPSLETLNRIKQIWYSVFVLRAWIISYHQTHVQPASGIHRYFKDGAVQE